MIVDGRVHVMRVQPGVSVDFQAEQFFGQVISENTRAKGSYLFPDKTSVVSKL